MKNAIKTWFAALVVYGSILVLVFGLTCGVHIVRSHFESRTFNKLTGSNTTTWDALWVQLRVVEPYVERN